MELKEITKDIFSLFSVKDAKSFVQGVRLCVFSQSCNSVYDKYIELLPDLSIDWMQRIYQFYCADRKEKKQDYTPVALSRLVAFLTNCDNETVVYDCCAGSGSLTIQKWNTNHDLQFVCEELDENVIPILLFNLCVRNITATVVRKNILTGEVMESYCTTKNSKYSTIKKMMFPQVEEIITDVSISNPPFNLGCDISEDLKQLLPKSYTCNFAFSANCLKRSKRYAAIILPQAVLSSEKEKDCRQYFMDKGWLKAAISLPEKMFESTPVLTCILLFDKQKTSKDVMLIDATKMSTCEVREQRGEGDASHYNRIYKKQFNTFTDIQIKAICELMNTEQSPVSKLLTIEEASTHKYTLSIGPYLPIEFAGTTHRDFNAIIGEINHIIRERNIIKVSVNKVWAKHLGLDEVIADCVKNNEIVKSLNQSFKCFKNYSVKEDIIENKYIQSSNNKVFLIENTDKERLSSIMPFFINMYKQHLYYLNNEENRLLAELRDSMLPFLLNGELEM